MRRGARALRAGTCAVALALGGSNALAQSSSPATDGPVGALDVLNDPQIPGSFVTLLLDNGDRLSGTVVRVAAGYVEIEHPVLNMVSVPTTRILRVELRPKREMPPPQVPTPLPGTVAEPTPDIDTGPPGEGGAAPEPAPTPPEKPKATWKTNIEFGVDGSQGNSERLNFRGGVRITRDTPDTAMRFNARYVVNTTDGERSTNRFTANLRNDWRLSEIRWSFFVQGGVELDEFRDFDSRVSGGAGFAYKFLDSDDTFLSARVGAGFAREFGGTDDDNNPELIAGLELSHKLTDRQTFTLTAEFYPDLDDFRHYRSVVRPAWEFRLDTKANLSLRLGFEHRYETQSSRDKESDLDYFATIVLSF